MRSIEIHIAALRVAHEGHGRVVVHEVAKAFLAFAQGDLGPFPFRDILNGAQKPHDPALLRVGYWNGRKADPAGISLPGDDAHFVHVALSGPHALLPVAVVAVVWMNQGLPTSPCLQFSDAIAGNALEARGRRLDADGAVRIDLAGIGVVGG